jgi:hypothetical protein
MFQGGGNIPLIMPVVSRLVARGHQVRIMASAGVRQSRMPVSSAFLERIRAAGPTLVPFPDPEVHPMDHAPRARGLIGGWVPKTFRSVPLEAQATLWAPVWAERFSAELRKAPPDVVVIDFVLLGAIAAAEAAGTPTVVLMHNVLSRPLARCSSVWPWFPPSPRTGRASPRCRRAGNRQHRAHPQQRATAQSRASTARSTSPGQPV